MSRGAHAAPKKHGPALKAARKALLRSGVFTGTLALSWTMVSALDGQGYLDAFAAGEESAAPSGEVDPSQEATPTRGTDPLARKVEALNAKYGCSSTGLEYGVVPVRTVVQVGGEIRLATFDEGWAMHLSEVPGTLVSVCAR